MPLLPLHREFVYGPVRSRRLGSSLGINVFPPGRKICNFNCAYCQYGWTRHPGAAVSGVDWPAPADIAHAARRALRKLHAASQPIDRVTLAGNGEPTLHPLFGEVVERLVLVRDEIMPSARLALLSNASTLERRAVLEALRWVEDTYLKLDAADPGVFRRLNGAPGGLLPPFATLGPMPRVTIQSLFTRDDTGRIDNTTPPALDMWLGALRIIRPAAVHIYTIDRDPAWSALRPISRAGLNAIAARVRAEHIEAYVF